jgi:hypothetical protein
MKNKKLEGQLEEFREDKGFKGKGQLSVALHVTRMAKDQGLPLKAEKLRTGKSGQVQGLSKSSVQAVLIDYGITRVLAEEGGRTSRGSLGNMMDYVAFLNQLQKSGLADLEAIESWWVDRVRDFFSNKPFTLHYDSSKSLRSIVSDLLEQAQKRQKENPGVTYAGTMLQHLVGAKLSLILPPDKRLKHHAAAAADASTSRAGDFIIDDVIIHVTTAPTEALMQKCKANLDTGLRPIIVTIAESRAGAESLAKVQGITDRVDIMEAEQFIAANVMEWGRFKIESQRLEVQRLIEAYNQIVESVETDLSLKVT